MENDPILAELTALVAPFVDVRDWVLVTAVKICDNCLYEYPMKPQLMKRDRRGSLFAADHAIPKGIDPAPVRVDSHYTRCWKCNGSRPLFSAIHRDLEGAKNDRELAQRLGVTLAAYIRASLKEAS